MKICHLNPIINCELKLFKEDTPADLKGPTLSDHYEPGGPFKITKKVA